MGKNDRFTYTITFLSNSRIDDTENRKSIVSFYRLGKALFSHCVFEVPAL